MPTEANLMIVSFPTSMPASEARAHVIPDAMVESPPTWSLQTLNLGPARSSPDYESHLARTVGSSYDWSDELRFARGDGRLCSVVLKTPEAGETDAHIAARWLAWPRRRGLPVLVQRDQGFHVDPLDTRYLAPDASGLIAAAADLAQPDDSCVRLEIAPDLDLLFQHGRYCGWILNAPLHHLGALPVSAPAQVDDAALPELLRAYLALLCEPNLSRMSDEDPTLLADLRALHTRATHLAGAAAGTIASSIERAIDTFYPAS